jgi:hypothetical protein
MVRKKSLPTLNGTHEFKPGQLPEVDQLLVELGLTAGNWRDTKEDRYITEYLRIYNQLRALKWEGALDIDMRLPARYMPEDYLKRFKAPAEQSTNK